MMESPIGARIEVSNGEVVPVDGLCSIGRASGNSLVLLGDEAVSRKHAVIQRLDGDDYWLLDLGSSNGTLLNGMPLVQPARLRSGDTIAIGDRKLVFIDESPSSANFTLAGSTLMNVQVAQRWLMVADIEGFTPLSQRLSTAELAQVVGQWFGQTRAAVEECGGMMHKYLGDGWLSGWGEEPGTAEKVARCLLRMVALRNDSPHKFRLILHHGDVTISGGRELIGPEVNFVFRMEKLASALKASFLLSASACERLALDPPAESRGCHELKGFRGSHEVFVWPV